MAAISLAKHAVNAFNKEKPHSSITDWVEILTSPAYTDESYDGIPDLIDSINLQGTGPAEASRALRKKIKHGDAHRQYRALVILKALVENCGTRFQTTFADGQLTDALRNMQSDSGADPRVRKKLNAILAHWQKQFKDDPNMSAVANLYKTPRDREKSNLVAAAWDIDVEAMEKRRAAEKEAKRRAKAERGAEKEAERLKKIEEARRAKAKANKPKRKPFDFEKEKPQVIQSIATASQAASNLVNALTLVNTETDSVQANARVQECLIVAKQSRKQIVRYIQLVENEELIGTLIESNERIIGALEMFDKLSKPDITEKDVEEVAADMQAAHIGDSEVGKLQEKQRAAVERSVNRGKGRSVPESVHPDLQDIGFGSLGGESSDLPAPIRPSAPADSEDEDRRGTLSDYSDYSSSDEESHNRNVGTGSGSRRPSSSKAYTAGDADEELDARKDSRKGLLDTSDDPFADPFADQDDVATPGIAVKQGMTW